MTIGNEVVDYAEQYFNIDIQGSTDLTDSKRLSISPKQAESGGTIRLKYAYRGSYDIEIKDIDNKVYYNSHHKLKKKTKIKLPTDLPSRRLQPGHQDNRR